MSECVLPKCLRTLNNRLTGIQQSVGTDLQVINNNNALLASSPLLLVNLAVNSPSWQFFGNSTGDILAIGDLVFFPLSVLRGGGVQDNVIATIPEIVRPRADITSTVRGVLPPATPVGPFVIEISSATGEITLRNGDAVAPGTELLVTISYLR